jgi:hypothetical protein
MKAYDFDAVIVDSEVYCLECVPDGTDLDTDASPIFADSEWDYYPVCYHCGAVHDYVSLTAYGANADAEPTEPEEDDYTTTDNLHWYGSGKLVFTGTRSEFKAWMEAQGYWPNCWVISDHGNAHLITDWTD